MIRNPRKNHELQADGDLELDAGIPLEVAHAIAHSAEEALVDSVPRLGSAVVHAYPATAPAEGVRARG